MVKWFVKIVVQTMVYSYHSNRAIKLAAYGEEIEKLCHIVATIQTSGIGHIEVEQLTQERILKSTKRGYNDSGSN